VCLNYCYHIYRNLSNFTYAFRYYHQKCNWPHFSWATLYVNWYFYEVIQGWSRTVKLNMLILSVHTPVSWQLENCLALCVRSRSYVIYCSIAAAVGRSFFTFLIFWPSYHASVNTKVVSINTLWWAVMQQQNWTEYFYITNNRCILACFHLSITRMMHIHIWPVSLPLDTITVSINSN